MNLAIQSGKEEIVSLLLSCQSLSGGGESSQVLPLLVQAITAGNLQTYCRLPVLVHSRVRSCSYIKRQRCVSVAPTSDF